MVEQVHIAILGRDQAKMLDQFSSLIQSTTGRPVTEINAEHDFSVTAEIVRLGQVVVTRIVSVQHEVHCPGAVMHGNSYFWTAVFQLSGCTRIEQRDNSHVLEPGSWSLNHSSADFRVEHLGPSEQIIIAIPKRLLPYDAIMLGQAMSGSRSARQGSALALLTFIRESLWCMVGVTEMGHAALGHAVIDMLRAALVDQADGAVMGGSNEVMRRRVLAYLEEHLADPDISSSRVAMALNCSRRYVHLVFQDAGETLFQTIMAMRLERARQDMSNYILKNCSIASIAYSVGFNDAAHFGRVFRKRFGISPGAFRASVDQAQSAAEAT